MVEPQSRVGFVLCGGDTSPVLDAMEPNRNELRKRAGVKEKEKQLQKVEGSCVLSVGVKVDQSVENRSPAEGSGASPPVTLGRRERSGRLWMWDFSSLRTCVTRASFCLYSCGTDSGFPKCISFT